jgi:beta-lactamase superfamily II metal-dependent hydrolase
MMSFYFGDSPPSHFPPPLPPPPSTHIVFLAVGDRSSGDAILVRTRDILGRIGAYLIDGGFSDTAPMIADQLRGWGVSHLEFIFVTHPDSDHVSGLLSLLDEIAARRLSVGALVMNEPWAHSSSIPWSLLDARYTAVGRFKNFVASCKPARELGRKARRSGIRVWSAFAGEKFGPFRILAPTRTRYLQLLQRYTDDASGSADTTLMPVASVLAVLDTYLGTATTSARNDSSLVLYLEDGPLRSLFTGDAGVDTLREAIWTAYTRRLPLNALDIFQLPHHGSRRNLSADILKNVRGRHAIISAGANDLDHPRNLVVAALHQYGWQVAATKGTHLHFWKGFSTPPGLYPMVYLPMPSVVEVPSVAATVASLLAMR